MFQIDPFKLSHLPLDFHPSKPFKTKVVLLCRICQLQSIRRSNKSRACGQCQHGYNLTQALNLTMGSKSSKLRRLERFQVLVHPKILATPVGFNQKNAWVVDVCRILNGILEAMPIVPQGSQRSQNGCQATQTTLPRRGRAKTTRKIAAKTTDASSKVWVDLFIRRLVQTTGKFFRKGMKMHVYVYKNTYVFYKYNIHPLETANKTETSSPFSEISAPLYLEPRLTDQKNLKRRV